MNIRPVSIRPALNGWIVEVGCQTLVFNHTDRLCEELERYLGDPVNVEKEYMTKSLNAKFLTGPVDVEPQVDPGQEFPLEHAIQEAAMTLQELLARRERERAREGGVAQDWRVGSMPTTRLQAEQSGRNP